MICSFMEVYMLTVSNTLIVYKYQKTCGGDGRDRQFAWISWSELHSKNDIYMTRALNKKIGAKVVMKRKPLVVKEENC